MFRQKVSHINATSYRHEINEKTYRKCGKIRVTNPSQSYGASPAIYEITQCYLPLDTGNHARLNLSNRSLIDIFATKGQEAELTLVVGDMLRRFTCPYR